MNPQADSIAAAPRPANTPGAAVRAGLAGGSMSSKLGVCQWFHFQDYQAVERTVGFLRESGARLLRTGVSWADFLRPGGRQWYDWQMQRLRDFDVLLSVWHTPPSLARAPACNAPPRRLRDYADFIDQLITLYGDCFSHLELWNEPNNRLKWDFPRFDPQWSAFAQMIGAAAYWARQRGVRTVLGGMIPVDHHWLGLMRSAGVLQHIDVIAVHAFPGMWFPDHPNWEWYDCWNGWERKLACIREHVEGKPLWVTETGLATWDLALGREAKYELQVQALDAAATAPAERVYWYSAIDLDPRRHAIEGFHVDENEYHMGLVKHDGYRKTAYERLCALMAT
jgi:CDP-paratose 2-epimerase